MARFYAKFDSGSAGWDVTLDGTTVNGWFDRMRISTTSASAALLRNGLIASRSALSADVYEDLDPTNQNGALGIYFPPDSGPRSTDGSTFISWSNAYTSSVPGIVIPADYRTRPTASILSTMTALVGPESPTDSIGVSYATYISASQAVAAVLNSIQNGAGTSTGPYTRLGNNPSRTLHTIWHDPNLQYFAWEDFTPGTPQSYTVQDPSDIGGTSDNYFYTSQYYITMSWGPTYQFRNDETARPVISATLQDTGSNVVQTLNATTLNAGAQTYFWLITATPADGDYNISTQLKFRDSRSLSEGWNSDGNSVSTTNANLMKLRRLFATQPGYRASYSSNCADYTSIGTYYYSPTDLGGGNFNMYSTTNTNNPTGAAIGYYNFGDTNVYVANTSGLLEPTTDCTGTPPGTTTTTTTTTAGCKQSGEACSSGFECCSGVCTGGNVCGEPE